MWTTTNLTDAMQSCACCTPALQIGRRGLLGLAGALGASAMLPRFARAASGHYDALLLTCIDPRFPANTIAYMRSRDLIGKYSQVSLAGASIAVVADPFKSWRPAFWENLSASISLHHVPKVIVLNHRECGAAGIAYGADSIATKEAENATHMKVFAEYRAQMKEKHADLQVETGLMALDGTVDMFTA